MNYEPVRASCGYLAGLLLHRALGEELCGVCTLLTETGRWKPLAVTPGEAAANQAALAQAVRPSLIGTPEGRSYDFPSII